MFKVDYVCNLCMEGVLFFVLEVFYDNIMFILFVFIEDDFDLKCIFGCIILLNFGLFILMFFVFLNGFNFFSKFFNKIDVYDFIVWDMFD